MKKEKTLLIESCEFVSKVKLSKSLKESVKMSAGKAGTLIVRNIPCTILNRRNQNGRIYSTEVLQEAIDNAKADFETKQLLSQGDEHPDATYVAPTHASHVVINAYIKKNINIMVEGKRGKYDVLFMDWEVLNTDEGKNLRALFEAECSIGTSIRGLGDLDGDMVENYQICGCDCVGNPSSSTFTRMPISESVKVSLENKNSLTEGFTVTTSSTDIAKDLENAARIQLNMEDARYGTVTKIGTKVDQENDPKTGAQTKITTVEGETSDDVDSLDQALAMAKNAFLNGSTHVDTVTIENIKEEEETKHESVEENEVPLMDSSDEYISEDDLNSNLGCVDCKESVAMTTINEANDENKDPKEGRKFVLKAPAGFVGMDGNALVFKKNPKEALHFINGKEESGLVHLSGVEKILDTMGVYDIEKYYRNPENEVDDKNANDTSDTNKDINVVSDLNSEDNQENTEVESTNLKEEGNDSSNSKYSVEMHLNKTNGGVEVNTMPVSSLELDSVISEVSNQCKQKEQSNDVQSIGEVYVIDNQTGDRYTFNRETNTLDSNNGVSGALTQQDPEQAEPIVDEDIPVEENPEAVVPNENVVEESDDGAIKQQDGKLNVQFDDGTTIEKDFGDTGKASVAKAGLENGKIDGNVMLSEEEVKEVDADAVKNPSSDGYDLEFTGSEEDLKEIESIFNKVCPQLKNDMYPNNNGTYSLISYMDDFGIQEPQLKLLLSKLNDNNFVLNVKDSSDVDIQDEDSLDEKLFTEPTEPSDDVVTNTLVDDVNTVTITLGDIDWDTTNLMNNYGDDVNVNDVMNDIDSLPDNINIEVSDNELKDIPFNYDNLLNYFIRKAEKQYNKKINDAKVINLN